MNPYKNESKTQPNRLTFMTNPPTRSIKKRVSAQSLASGKARRSIDDILEQRRLHSILEAF